MPSYGTKIADYKGVLHEVSKSAFDVVAVASNDREIMGATEPIRSRITETLEKLGLEVDWSEPGALEKLMKNSAAKIASAYAGKVVASAAAVLYGEEVIAAEVAGPIGAAIGLISEIAIMSFNRLKDYTPPGGYNPGQWVMIDNGPKTVSRQVERAISWGEIEMFGDAPSRVDLELDREEDYSLGFVMGPGPEQGEWTVFNFESSLEETLKKHAIRPVDEATSQSLDNNPQISIVRDIKFVKDEQAFLEGRIPTREGSQVIFQNKVFRIVKTNGNQALIENDDGDQITTNINNLIRGRVSSNLSKNTKDGIAVSDGFNTQQLDIIFTGQWVWVPPSLEMKIKRADIERSLSVVVNLERNRVRGVHALNGKTWELEEDQIQAADLSTTVSTISGIKEFTEFQKRCISGRASQSELEIYSPGKKYPYVCVGIGQPEGQETRYTGIERQQFGKPDYNYVNYVGDHGEKEETAAQEERVQMGYEIAGNERRVFPEGKASGSGNMMILAAAGAICLFIFWK